MNIVKSFADFMDAQGYGTQGTDLFIGAAPQGSPDKSWWIIGAGGSSTLKGLAGNKMKNYLLNVFYRNTDQEDVMNTLQSFEEFMNSGICDQLNGYNNIEIEATSFPADQDLEAEDRTVGLVQVTVTVYTN